MNENSLLQLKGTLVRARGKGNGGLSLGARKTVSQTEIEAAIKQLQFLESYFSARQEFINGALINCEYEKVVSKSSRLKAILSKNNGKNIVGAKFGEKGNKCRYHIITYYVSFDNISDSIDLLSDTKDFLNAQFGDSVSNTAFKAFVLNKGLAKRYKKFLQTIIDISNVSKFTYPSFSEEINDLNIVTFYKTDMKLTDLLIKLDILSGKTSSILDENTFILDNDSLNKCSLKANFLIAMSLDVFSYYDFLEEDVETETAINILPEPKNEPIIGVIDTLFDQNAYFSRWVDYVPLISIDEPKMEDKMHSTKVASIIVDGPALNPGLDDGCGRFRVKLFGLAVHGKNNNFEIMSNIEKIIVENPTIHVWNLSLGSRLEISRNFISPEAYCLDKLQAKYNVLFVVAATNSEEDIRLEKSTSHIGSPADSINSIVVGSCNFNKEPASYSRRGGVLSFFIKPDVLYYGGDFLERPIITNNGVKNIQSQGTSFAAPWIARKACYLIDVLGFNREIAKALLIDSASSWNGLLNSCNAQYTGYGVVPINIKDVVYSPADEIRFFISDQIRSYKTGSYTIPVPFDANKKFPFYAKATLCYFPNCFRNQGVDYTSTELDLRLGRMKNGGGIDPIDNNTQQEDGSCIKEEDAREFFRKWDNVKHLCEKATSGRPRKAYSDKWGFEISTKERSNNDGRYGYSFGLVITLKEMKGLNRQDQFIKECSSSGWIVSAINIENSIKIFNDLQAEVKFEE